MSIMPGFPVPRAQWVTSAEACAACGKRFTFFTSKENCPCCGRLFCSACLPAECTLSPVALPSSVCIECFRRIQDWRRAEYEQQQQSLTPASASAATASASPALEARLNFLEAELRRTTGSARQLREESDTLIDLLAAKDACIAELTEAHAKTEASLSAAENSISTLRSQLHAANTRGDTLKSQLGEAEQRAATTLAQTIEEAKATWVAQTTALSVAAREAEETAMQRTEELNELRAAMRATNAHSESQIVQLTEQLQAARATVADLQRECQRQSDEHAATEQAHRDLQDEVQRLSERLTAAQEELAAERQLNVQERARALSLAAGTAAAEAANQQQAVSALTHQLRDARDSLETAEAALANASAEVTQLREDARRIADDHRNAVDELQRRLSAQQLEAQAELADLRAQLADARAAPAPVAHGASRWGRPSIVEAVRYPAVADVDADAIAPVAGVERWEFDTVAEAERGGEADVLLRVGHQIARDWALFPDRAAQHCWARLLATAQANYPANSYHNRVHAADVLQGTYALVCCCPDLLAHMTALEKRAVVFAAAMHDLRHPGRAEVFLKNTFDGTYLHYNGMQVLEQMHTATAFELLATPELDFTSADMDDAAALQFHGLVTALIACTFMGRHGQHMEQWTKPLREGRAYDVTAAADRLQVLSLFLHAADIGAQARGLGVARKWLGIVEEMCAQGDEEAALGLAVSPGGSRSASLEGGQLFFMETFVIPLFDVVQQLFPAIESPMQQLRAVHAHYCGALKDTRSFPSPVRYAAVADTSAEDAAAARAAELDAREARLTKQEKAIELAVRRLREATGAVAQRERLLSQREAVLIASEEAVVEKMPSVSSVTPSGAEEDLVRATAAVMAREAEVQRRTTELKALRAELEAREAATSRLSAQLATIAEKVNGRRQILRYREARVRSTEAALKEARDAAILAVDGGIGALGRGSRAVLPSASALDMPTVASVSVLKLEGALEKLVSALQYM